MAKYLDNDGLLYLWQKIKDKFAAKTHSHAIGDVTDLQTTLNGKAASSHSHAISDVTNLQTTLDGKAPKSHASSSDTYGKGTSSNYGHVKLSDSTSATTAAASGGTAATPKAVSDALAAAKEYADNLETGVTGVKGNAESSYRTGQVNLTPANIGAAAASHSHDATDVGITGTNTDYDGDTMYDFVADVASWIEAGPSFDAQNPHEVLIGPSSGDAAIPTFRALVASDIPGLPVTKITSGTLGVARGGTGVSTLGAGVVYHAANGTGAMSIATAANLVSAIGNSAVNRATADASGNNIADTYAKKTDLAGLYKYKGSVAAEANLPTTGQSTGDVYNIESASSYGAAGANVAWNGSAWDSLGEVFTINSITNAEIDTIVAS